MAFEYISRLIEDIILFAQKTGIVIDHLLLDRRRAGLMAAFRDHGRHYLRIVGHLDPEIAIFFPSVFMQWGDRAMISFTPYSLKAAVFSSMQLFEKARLPYPSDLIAAARLFFAENAELYAALRSSRATFAGMTMHRGSYA